jgi:hypothetical protein
MSMDVTANFMSYRKYGQPESRYSTYDYCFRHFQQFNPGRGPASVRFNDVAHMETSCLHLGFYLASWGMYRGSSGLLQHSMTSLIPVVLQIVQAGPAIWETDVDVYDEDVVGRLLEFAEALRRALPKDVSATDTLVTKIMLGTFGNVTAFDVNVRAALRAEDATAKFGRRALLGLRQVWEAHRLELEAFPPVPVLMFPGTIAGSAPLRYRKAKLLDMVLFKEGEIINDKE